MSQKALITLLVIVIIILTGTTVYFATISNIPSPQPIPDETVEATTTESITTADEKIVDTTTTENTTEAPETSTDTDEAMRWQTYEEDITGFSIKYPNDWPVRKPNPNDCGENKICEVAFGNLPKEPGDSVAIQNLINILIHSPGAIESNDGDGFSNCRNIRETTLTSGLQAETKECDNDLDGSLQYIYTFKKNGWWYQIISRKGSEAVKVFDDMADSFTFTR